MLGIKKEELNIKERRALYLFLADRQVEKIHASLTSLGRLIPKDMEFTSEDIRAMAISTVISIDRHREISVPFDYHPTIEELIRLVMEQDDCPRENAEEKVKSIYTKHHKHFGTNSAALLHTGIEIRGK